MSPKRAAKSFLRIGVTIACLYAGAVGLLALFQRQLIYHPVKAGHEELAASARAAGFSPWSGEKGQSIGWRRDSPRAPSVGAVLVVHGNAGYALHRAAYADALQETAPVDVYILEYPGFGDRAGASSERSFYAAADEGMRMLGSDVRLFVLGESLGTGVASYLAGAYPDRIAGLLLVAPYDRLVNVARNHMPLFPVDWFLRDRFDSADHLKKYRGRVGVWVGENDTVVPAQFGLSIYEDYGGPKKLWLIPGAGHEDVLREPPRWWKEAADFLQIQAARLP